MDQILDKNKLVYTSGNNEIYEKVPSTAKIAFYRITSDDTDFEINSEWFEWSSELLKSGYTSEHIIALNQKAYIDNPIKLIGLINVIFDELNLNDADTILKYYGIYIIREGLSHSKDMYDILTILKNIYNETNNYLFYDFHMLYLAYTELKKEGEQLYWKGLNLKNKQEYVRLFLIDWTVNPRSRIISNWQQKSKFRKTIETFCFSRYAFLFYVTLFTSIVFAFHWLLFKLFNDSLLNRFLLIISISVFILITTIRVIEYRKEIRKNKKTKAYSIMTKPISKSKDCKKQEYTPIHIAKEDKVLSDLLQKVPSTAKILLYKQQNSNINTQWINWAIDMIQTGYETENITILAGEDIHCNPFEFATLTDKIFEELHLNQINADRIFMIYSAFLIQQVLQSPNKNIVRKVLKKLEKLCIDNKYNDTLYDFYLLSNAIEELEECGNQWYWNNSSLTKENWYEYVLEYFKQYIINLF